MPRSARIVPAILTLALLTITEIQASGPGRQLTIPCGARYTWSSIQNPAMARYGHTAVWTGSEMIVWGGRDADGVVATGMRYDPLRDSWLPTSPSPLEARGSHTAVWTGTEMIIWGGGGVSGTFKNGARYNPRNDSWTMMTSLPFPAEGRLSHAAVWTGSRLIIWGGMEDSATYLDSGGVYDPATDTWELMSQTNAPVGRSHTSGVWTGEAFIVWGGLAHWTDGGEQNTGGRYDPASDTWLPTSVIGAPSARYAHGGFWTGSRLLIWSNPAGDSTGGLYDPLTDSWIATPTSGAPPASGTMTWNGEELLVWSTNQEVFRFDPALSQWRTDPQAPWAPSQPRHNATAVLAEGSVIVWGGNDSAVLLGDGGRYFPDASPDEDQDGVTLSCGDCRESDAAVYPGAPQVCDGINNDCTDPAFPSLIRTNEYDDDDDGLSECAEDCDDSRDTVYPGAPPICDGRNNDCLDPDYPGLNGNEVDHDGDNQTGCGGDCDESTATVYSGAPQICDDLNNDCADPAWPSPGGTELDLDGDSFRPCDGDCDDASAAVLPGGTQVCDGVNNDCNDPDWPSTLDTNDGDDDADGYSICQGDCDPARPSVHPGALEICDGLNNDCGDPAWPALPASELDGDGDGFPACLDCDDGNTAVHIGALQVCDGVNNDCSTPGWPDLAGTNESDADGDGYSFCALDCNDTVGAFWHRPAEARDLVFWPDAVTMSWLPPELPGSVDLRYDVLRSLDAPAQFQTAACLVTGTQMASAADTEYIPEGSVFFYHVRASNGCGDGPAGYSSAWAEVPAVDCP